MHSNAAAQPVAGSITLDGDLADWTVNDQIDDALTVPDYDIYAKASGASVVFALHAPIAIGANTTVWLNTDQRLSTGFLVFGFTGGAEFNVNFDAEGVPHLYIGDAGQSPVPGDIRFATSADHTVVEFEVPLSALGSPDAINTLWDVNDFTFLPTSYALSQYEVVTSPRTQVVGSVTLDGSLSDWTAAERIDWALGVPGYDVYGKATGGFLVLALQAPVAIDANTTVWLNTDQNQDRGFQVFGFTGGAEFNINFDIAGTPRLYTGDAGQNRVPGLLVSYGASVDRHIVELAVPLDALESPSVVGTLWDVNDSVFVPTSFDLAQYPVIVVPLPAVVGTVTLDGSLAEWTAADHIDQPLSVAGYDIYATVTGDAYVFALSTPILIGANTTAWLNTDQNAATGFQIFGFAGGAEFNVNFDESGIPRLYTGNAGETLVAGVEIAHAYSADRTVVEFALPASAVGSPGAINTLWDVNDFAFLPTSFALAQYRVWDKAAPPAVVGDVTIDGSLAEWGPAHQIDRTLTVFGYDIYAQTTGGSLVFALQAPVAIDAETTAWLNTDQNATAGFQIFGFAGGAEFNVNFDTSGTPRLYTGDAGETLVPGVNVPHAYSSDHTIVEFAVPLTAIGSPAFVTTLWDVNNATFLPTDFSLTHYEIGTDATALASAIVPRSATSAPNVGAGAGSVLSLADVFVGTPTVSDVAAPRGTVQLQPALTLLLNDESATAHLLTV